jgi:prepilin-type N-terminal cleavage/methylation domain-containing protein
VQSERGFTLIELIIVLFILGILAAVVVVNVVGLTNRGEAEGYASDLGTIQLAVSAFYADAHAYSSAGGWDEAGNYTSVHNYPTMSGADSELYLGNEVRLGKYTVHAMMDGNDSKPATTDDIIAATIWMGLLVNGPGTGTGLAPVPDTKDNSAPLRGESGPYLNPLPRSCSEYNFSVGTGTITWVVGAYGRVYGVFEQNGVWYSGYGGRYP